MSEVHYVPVVNTHIVTNLINGSKWKEFDFAFFTKDSIFRHTHALLNPFHCGKTWENNSQKFNLDKNCFLFADSGGLQEVTLGSQNTENISFIKQTFLWQQEFCNAGFSFDVIPFETETWTFLEKEFENCARKTKYNIDLVLPLKTKPDFQFYGIIQGRQYDEYKRWYDIIKNPNLNGYCVKSPTVNPISCAETAIFALENLNTPIHFLGVGNITRSIVPIYLSNFYNHRITFDSSSYDIGAQYRSFLLPHSPGKKIRIMKESKFDWDLPWFCDCEICKTITQKELKDMIKNNDNRLGPLITLHNLKLYVKLINFLIFIKHDKEMIIDFFKTHFRDGTAEKVKTALDFIDCSVTNGFNFAKQKFKLFQPKKIVEKNINLYSWS